MPPRTEVPWTATVPEILGEAPAEGGAAWIGRIIDDRYRIVELLGEGGMGNVYVAEHLKLHKLVALKTIRAEFASNAQAEARFKREALATAQLDHPHVASALDFGHLPEGGAYLVIQLVRGVSLAAHLDTHGKIGWGTVADLGSQIADALAAAHAAGIVHRDLKPDNILIEARDDGRLLAKVVDFGIARIAEDLPTAESSGKPLTRFGSILGTPGYMPPEQAVGEPVDARGDLYSLGVILWECCSGRRLWQGESITELVACQLGSTPPTLLQEVGGQVPEALSELVAQLLSVAPKQRPEAAGPVRDTLRRLAVTRTAPGAPQSSFAQGNFNNLPAGHSLPAAVLPTASPWRTGTLAVWQTLQSRTRTAWHTPETRRRLVPAAVGGAVALVLVCGLALRGGDEAPTASAESPVVAAPGADAGVLAGPPAAPPEPTPTDPSVAPAAKPPANKPATTTIPTPSVALKPATPVAEPPLPIELAGQLATLLASDDKGDRKRAAERVLAHKPKEDVPTYVLNLAWLEKAGNCPSKRAVIEKMEAAADARVLPALRRLSTTRRRGCGFFNRQDCLACLREPLAGAIGRLEAVAPPPNPTGAQPAPPPAP